jgi:hypothetical protein
MSDVTEYGAVTFDDISLMGDNSDRVNDIMAVPTIGQKSIVRYKVPSNHAAKVTCIAAGCNFGALLLSGAYTTAQNGARIQLRFGGTIYLEHYLNWTGLSGYIGGADDYNAENETMLPLYEVPVAASTAIDLRVTGGTNVRRMVYIELYGTLDDGTEIGVRVKQAVDGTTATDIAIYTVPGGRVLRIRLLVVKTRHIDLYAGKGYLVYNGLPVMAFDVMQTEIGGVNGIVFPLWGIPVHQSASIGIRMDDFECGNELVTASIYAKEESMDPLDGIVEGTVTLRQAMRVLLDAAAADTVGFPGSPIIKSLDGTKNRIEATLDVNRNRTVIARDLT